MGLRSGLPNLGPPRRRVADLAAPIQLAPAAQQPKIKIAHQPPRSDRGQPVEAPHLATKDGSEEACLIRVQGSLAAVLVQLEAVEDDTHEDSWYLTTGFGPWDREALTFPTLGDAEQWVRTKLYTSQ